MHNGILILPHYISFNGKLGLKQPLIFTDLSRQGCRQNFKSRNKDLVHNGILILPHYIFSIAKLAFFQTNSYLYRLGKTWLNTKFHVANSRKQGFLHNGIFILPHYVCFISKLGLKQPVIFKGMAKHGWRQNFMYLNPETKVWCVMVSWFYLIMYVSSGSQV